jgi:hypothetical protein
MFTQKCTLDTVRIFVERILIKITSKNIDDDDAITGCVQLKKLAKKVKQIRQFFCQKILKWR